MIAPVTPWRTLIARASLIATLVGTLLVVINHGDHLSREPACHGFYWKLALSYCVPFLVSLSSAALARRDAARVSARRS